MAKTKSEFEKKFPYEPHIIGSVDTNAYKQQFRCEGWLAALKWSWENSKDAIWQEIEVLENAKENT